VYIGSNKGDYQHYWYNFISLSQGETTQFVVIGFLHKFTLTINSKLLKTITTTFYVNYNINFLVRSSAFAPDHIIHKGKYHNLFFNMIVYLFYIF
jgi:hypothetical protein